VNWPEGEEEEIPEVAKDITMQLLCHDPMARLGSSIRGGTSVKKGTVVAVGCTAQPLYVHKYYLYPLQEWMA